MQSLLCWPCLLAKANVNQTPSTRLLSGMVHPYCGSVTNESMIMLHTIGGVTVHGVCLAYTLLNFCMPSIHKFRPSEINLSSTKSSMITTVTQLCSGWFDQPRSHWFQWVNVLEDYSVSATACRVTAISSRWVAWFLYLQHTLAQLLNTQLQAV